MVGRLGGPTFVRGTRREIDIGLDLVNISFPVLRAVITLCQSVIKFLKCWICKFQEKGDVMAQDPKNLSMFDNKKKDGGVSLERLAQIVKDRDIEIVETPPKARLIEK